MQLVRTWRAMASVRLAPEPSSQVDGSKPKTHFSVSKFFCLNPISGEKGVHDYVITIFSALSGPDRPRGQPQSV